MPKPAASILTLLKENIQKVFVGREETVDLVLTALICGGHVLIEDVPGLGKTTLVRSLARSLGLSFARIPFTPDLTPPATAGGAPWTSPCSTWPRGNGRSIWAA